MSAPLRWSVVALVCSLIFAPVSRAEQVRFRFVPADANGNLKQVAAGPNGALGERLRGVSRVPEPYPKLVQPNVLVTIRDPYSGRNVTVPLRLPEDTPRLEHRTDRVIYNYGTFTVTVRFFADGSVETIYSSGFLRPLSLNY